MLTFPMKSGQKEKTPFDHLR